MNDTNTSRSALAVACDIIATRAPEFEVSYEYPGMIAITRGDRGLMWGTVNETINGDPQRLDGEMWDYDAAAHRVLSPDALDTGIASDSTDPNAIACAILRLSRRWFAQES